MDCLRCQARLARRRCAACIRRSKRRRRRASRNWHAKEEGIEFFFLHGRSRSFASGRNVRGMKVQKMVLGEPDEKAAASRSRRTNSFELECDTVITRSAPRPTDRHQVDAGPRAE